MNTKDTFAKDRERLNAKKEEIAAKKAALDEELAGVNRELAAIDAYLRVFEGNKKKKTGRAPRGEKTQKDIILAHVTSNPGQKSGEIAKALELNPQRASNVLAALKKDGKVTEENRRYSAA